MCIRDRHEYVGEVVEVGAGVKGFNIGDRVSGEGHITCGKCRNCLEGHKENCKDAKGVGCLLYTSRCV